MQILLANAKIMNEGCSVKPLSVPMFQHVADVLAAEMAQVDATEMAQMLGCSLPLAMENCERYRAWGIAEKMPAIMAYNGQAYKHLKAATLSPEALDYAGSHLWITCFLYGLLRPMDAIAPYRMEHTVVLEATGDRPMNQFWRDRLTDVLIHSVKADDGILLHLSTTEYEHLFDWKRVKREVTVIKPVFYARNKRGDLQVQAVWAKACRGAMVRFVLENRITDPEMLTAFTHEGFFYNPEGPAVAPKSATRFIFTQ
ncbi:MAG: YaaA family protein [Bacteroidales bacterium]|nr:YaaA family protein [Bacteroidales bacterium]